MNTKTMQKEPSESQIEEMICRWLSFFRDGMVYKIAPSGFFNGKRFVKHKNEFIKNGHPDIVFHHSGKVFYFEVKKPSEHKYILKHYVSIKNSLPTNKKKKHIKDQIEFIEKLNSVGHVAEFVSSLENVKKIIDKNLKKI